MRRRKLRTLPPIQSHGANGGTGRRELCKRCSTMNQSKLKQNQNIQLQMLDKAIQILEDHGIIIYIVCSFHPFETINVIDKIVQKHKNIRTLGLQSDKMIKRQNGYFINPLKFKDLGGSDIFFVSVLEKTK